MTGVARRHSLVAGRSLEERDGRDWLFHHSADGFHRLGLRFGCCRHLMLDGDWRRDEQLAEIPGLCHHGERDGSHGQRDRGQIEPVTRRASRAPRCSSGLHA